MENHNIRELILSFVCDARKRAKCKLVCKEWYKYFTSHMTKEEEFLCILSKILCTKIDSSITQFCITTWIVLLTWLHDYSYSKSKRTLLFLCSQLKMDLIKSMYYLSCNPPKGDIKLVGIYEAWNMYLVLPEAPEYISKTFKLGYSNFITKKSDYGKNDFCCKYVIDPLSQGKMKRKRFNNDNFFYDKEKMEIEWNKYVEIDQILLIYHRNKI